MIHQEYISPQKLIKNDDMLLLFNIIEKHGGILRFVGGYVRDTIAGIPHSDIDIVTDLSPSEFFDICNDEGLKCVPIGIQFFTLGVFVHNSFFKITCLSTDDDSGDAAWKNDAAHRDLTINAVYADEKGNVFDYYNGIRDLENGVIKFIGKPQQNIEADYIRIIRFFRFCALFGKKIDRKSLKCCIENRQLLQKVSKEKIKEEFFKIIMAPYAVRALQLVFDHNILDFFIIPPKNYKKLEKYIKTEEVLLLEKNVILRLYILFEPSPSRAENLSKKLHLTKEQKDLLVFLCKTKINFKDTVSINKIIYQYGKDFCRNLFLATACENLDFEQIKDFLNTLNLLDIPTFPLNGKDLIKIGADKKFIGLYLDVLKKEWFENGCALSKEDLIDRYSKIFKYTV